MNHKRRRFNRRGRPDGEARQNKHPSHLKGREIGLFYARRAQDRREKDNTRPLGAIVISPSRRKYIQTMLASLSNVKLLSVKDHGSVQDSAFKRNFMRVINETIDDKLEQSSSKISENHDLDRRYQEQFLAKLRKRTYLNMQEKRMKLPSYAMKDKILNIIKENQVVVISGETGCGKTTQVAQFILDDFLENGKGWKCKILCTQPRRISAVSVAQRVAEERGESLGETVGYHIRVERRWPRDRGSICFCTTGVVLKMMECDPSLSSVSHLILDEIHERDVTSDFVLAVIKKVITLRKDLKVILMSATLNSEKFSEYYDDAPHLNIPGFTYPVEEFYLEDVLERTGFVYPERRFKKNEKLKNEEYSQFIEPHVRLLERTKQYSRNVSIQLRNPQCDEINLELIVELLRDICRKDKDDSAILVFLTGFAEISALNKLITESGFFHPSKYLIFPLHSQMPTIEQRQIFETPPPGRRKIVIATNIAETSITIDDVVYVIDCGKIKVTNFDAETNTEILAPDWVSLANASQRRGRAGRVKPGVCFHLFSKARRMLLDQYQRPEILRSRLEGVILTAKILQLGKIEEFFECLLDSPDPGAVSLALRLLKRLDALTDDEKLTPLGYHLARLPMAPQMGKMILFGAIFSCLDPVLSVAATLDYKEPFQLPLGKEKEADRMKQELANGMKSDHLLFHEVLRKFQESHNTRQFCRHYFLNYHTLKQLQDMKKQFMEYLYQMRFVPDTDPHTYDCNLNSNNLSLVKAVICAGLYPNIAISKKLGRKPTLTPELEKLDIHPKSILSECKYFDTNILIYYRKVYSNRDYIHDASLIYPLPVIFFGDKFTQTHQDGQSVIRINDNLNFKCNEENCGVIKELRDRFNWFLEYKISHPGPIDWRREDETTILRLIMELITCEDLEVYDDDAFDDQD